MITAKMTLPGLDGQEFVFPEKVNKKWLSQVSHLDECFKHVTNWDVAIDCGANVGLWATKMASKFKFVYAFEPDPQNFECLKINCGHLENVALINKGVSREADRWGQERGTSHGNHLKKSGKDVVEVVSLDTLKVGAVGFLKIDVEGHEGMVLEGASDVLKDRPVVCIEDKPKYLARYDARNPFETLKDAGYEIVNRVGKDVILK